MIRIGTDYKLLFREDNTGQITALKKNVLVPSMLRHHYRKKHYKKLKFSGQNYI
jgi:hypothetical protein